MNYLVTYCDDLPDLQDWLEANAEDHPEHIYYCRKGFSHEYTDYVFIFIQKSETIKNETGDKTLSFVVASDSILELLEDSPLDILGYGATPNEPYAAILADDQAYAKFRSVISEQRQLDEFGGDFNFCRIQT